MNKVSGTQVLIFDSDSNDGNFFVEIFERQGLTAKSHLSGENAITRIKEEKPNLLVLDLSTPGLNGEAICEALRNDPSLRSIKLVVVGGYSFADNKTRAIWAQADFYAPKPIDVAEFSNQTSQLIPSAVPGT